MNRRISPEAWISALTVGWDADAPNYGFMLVDANGGIAGTYLAFYSRRSIEGKVYRLCNLAAWCVLEHYRGQSLRLLRALLSQQGYHFTDLSPTGNVIGLNLRLNFRMLDTATALMPNLPDILVSRRHADHFRRRADPAPSSRERPRNTERPYEVEGFASSSHQKQRRDLLCRLSERSEKGPAGIRLRPLREQSQSVPAERPSDRKLPPLPLRLIGNARRNESSGSASHLFRLCYLRHASRCTRAIFCKMIK